MWEAPSGAPCASRADRVGRPCGQVQLRERRRTRAPTGARGDPRPTPSPRAGNWAGSGGADRPGRHSIYGPARVTWARARPLLLWSAQGTRAGTQAASRLGDGAPVPNTQIWLEKGSDIPAGRRGGGAPAGYIKPEREDQRPPQRTAPREASLPSRGDQGPSRRAAGVATRPGRAGVGEGAGDRRTIGQGDKVTGHHRGEPGELRGRTQPTHLISPKACFLPAHPVAWSSEPHALYRGGPRPSALGNISKFIPSPFGLLYLAFRMCRVD